MESPESVDPEGSEGVESNERKELDDDTMDKSGFIGAGVALRGESASLTFSLRIIERGRYHPRMPAVSLGDSAMDTLLTVLFGGWL